MIKARQARMLDMDKMDRMLSASSYQDAAKQLVDCGYEDFSGMDAKALEVALSNHREKIFTEIEKMSADKKLVEAFKLKYDYHNAKVIIKAEGAGVSGDHLKSSAGRVSFEELETAYVEESFRFLPEALGKAMADAKSILARTANPQLADFSLDRAYFAELKVIADESGSEFLAKYVKVQIDAANLKTVVRTVKMGKNQDFLQNALISGGDVSNDRLIAAAVSGDGLQQVFVATYFEEAAALGYEATKAGSMTKFELALDNAVSNFLGSSKLTPFGAEVVVSHLALVENEITAVRMILSGRLASIDPQVIRERLRDLDA